MIYWCALCALNLPQIRQMFGFFCDTKGDADACFCFFYDDAGQEKVLFFWCETNVGPPDQNWAFTPKKPPHFSSLPPFSAMRPHSILGVCCYKSIWVIFILNLESSSDIISERVTVTVGLRRVAGLGCATDMPLQTARQAKQTATGIINFSPLKKWG